MSSGPLLVPGDDVEAQTRAAFTRAMHASLRTVREIADAGPGTALCERRQAPGCVPSPPVHARVPVRPAAEATRSGWLVAIPATPADDPTAGPLSDFGVAVKDVIDVAGLPTRNGTPGGGWREPITSAEAWERVAAAGARCVGKAATHEMAWGVTTPQIANPHDAHRIAGGSSGGSAACVAADFATAALGTDTGGSVRIPASLCGVVGLRPTHARIPMTGITPLAPSQDVVGPMAGDVATCAALLEVLLGRNLHRSDKDASTLRVGVLAEPGDLDQQTDSAFRRTLTQLASIGVEMVEVDAALNRSSGALSLLTMLAESAQLHAGRVLAAPHAFGGEARALLTLGLELAESRDVLDAARVALVGQTIGLLGEHRLDAVLTPTTPCVAPSRGARAVRLGSRQVPVATALTRYTAWASATGLPAISVPVTSDGLPVGMQLMGAPDAEATLLLLARAVEQSR